MAVSLNSLVGRFNSSTFHGHQHMSKSSIQTSAPPKAAQLASSVRNFGSRMRTTGSSGIRRREYSVSVADSDHLVTNSSNKDSEVAASSSSDSQVSAVDSVGGNGKLETDSANGSVVSVDLKEDSRGPELQSAVKRSPLTARERLKAARVLSRNKESKKSKKSEMGSKVLDAMRQADGPRKRSGLPEAPINLFDDSKRGLPKPGWTFNFPGGSDLFVIVLSFVTISTIMFATTYVVWKVGAIHFNEY